MLLSKINKSFVVKLCNDNKGILFYSIQYIVFNIPFSHLMRLCKKYTFFTTAILNSVISTLFNQSRTQTPSKNEPCFFCNKSVFTLLFGALITIGKTHFFLFVPTVVKPCFLGCKHWSILERDMSGCLINCVLSLEAHFSVASRELA